MNLRKLGAIIAAIAAFLAVGSLIALLADNILGSFTRLLVLFGGITAASFAYNLIKGEEPEEAEEKQGITSEEISKRLEEKRKGRMQ